MAAPWGDRATGLDVPRPVRAMDKVPLRLAQIPFMG